MVLYLLLFILVLAGIFIWFQLPLTIFAVAVVIALGTFAKLADAAFSVNLTLWFAYLLFFIPVSIVPLRRRFISHYLLQYFRRIFPTMSVTEREALEAGTVGWDAELFSGKPNWHKLQQLPSPHLSNREKEFLAGPVDELCRRLNDWQITHRDKDLPPEIWRFMRKHRFFAMHIPKQYGGLEFSAQAHSAVIMKISTRSITAAVTVMVPNALGAGVLLMEYGTDKQKKKYLPRMAEGKELSCFALTAPEAGSDAGGMLDCGIVCKGTFRRKKNVLGIRLTWNKRYITLAPIATLLGLAFKLKDPDRLLGGDEDIGITLALIPTRHKGVNIGSRHYPLNTPFQNGPTSGDDVFVPMDWIIGGPERVGQGWRMLMECLSDGRGISLPALSVGATKFACRTSGAYALVRKQFNLPIGEFEGVQECLGRMAAYTYLMDATRQLTLVSLDLGEKPSVTTAIIKYHLTEKMRQVINDAMDVHGGKAVMLGPSNYLACMYQAIPVSITVEGANILTRNMIIFGQGAIRCHPYLFDEMQAIGNADVAAGLRQFDRSFFKHIGFFFANTLRTLALGLSKGYLCFVPSEGGNMAYYRQLSRMSAAFAWTADVAMLLLGGTLKRREQLSARLGDVLSNLYLASATLWYFQKQGRSSGDRMLAVWGYQRCLYDIQEAFYDFLNNFPYPILAAVLKVCIFPYGRSYRKPSDQITQSIAKLLISDNTTRNRLTHGIYLPDKQTESVACLERAFTCMIAYRPEYERLEKALRKGELESITMTEAVTEAVNLGMIKADRADGLREAIKLQQAVIKVDDFSAKELIGI